MVAYKNQRKTTLIFFDPVKQQRPVQLFRILCQSSKIAGKKIILQLVKRPLEQNHQHTGNRGRK
ncbi:hypothetical protein GGU45_002208 [Niabella hirudinis]